MMDHADEKSDVEPARNRVASSPTVLPIGRRAFIRGAATLAVGVSSAPALAQSAQSTAATLPGAGPGAGGGAVGTCSAGVGSAANGSVSGDRAGAEPVRSSAATAPTKPKCCHCDVMMPTLEIHSSTSGLGAFR